MSRGLGSLQRRVLVELEHADGSAAELCTRAYGAVTVSNYSAIRRAIRGLERRGLVRNVRQTGRSPHGWQVRVNVYALSVAYVP